MMFVSISQLPDTNTTVELHIFDCAGQEIFTELTTKYVSNTLQTTMCTIIPLSA